MTFGVMVSGFRVEISFRVTRVWDLGVTVSGFGGRVLSLQYQEFRVWNFEGRVSGIRVSEFGVLHTHTHTHTQH